MNLAAHLDRTGRAACNSYWRSEETDVFRNVHGAESVSMLSLGSGVSLLNEIQKPF